MSDFGKLEHMTREGRLEARVEALESERDAALRDVATLRKACEQLAEKCLSLCLECGPNVDTDEDGCCGMCGGSATGSYLDTVRAVARAALAATDKGAA